MFQRILVPLDGSARAEQALPVAARIARATGGSLLLVQVVSPPIEYNEGLAPVAFAIGQGIEAEMASATRYLQSLADSSTLRGIATRVEGVFGFPVPHLLAFAEAPGIDLVVLCSHGRTGFARWVMGSVAHALVHQCSVPLLVLRQGTPSSLRMPVDSTGSFRTLVPLDGSKLAEAALGPAAHLTAALAGTGQGTLHVSQVVKRYPTTVNEGFVSELNDEARERARSYLNQVEEHVRPELQKLRLSLTHSVELESDVASALVNLAEHGTGSAEGASEAIGPCDLIAISTHGRAGLERWVMGSVTERLLHTATLPMLIVRPPRAE